MLVTGFPGSLRHIPAPAPVHPHGYRFRTMGHFLCFFATAMTIFVTAG